MRGWWNVRAARDRQYLNHVRPDNLAITNIRDAQALIRSTARSTV
jgi:hypothetical protein